MGVDVASARRIWGWLVIALLAAPVMVAAEDPRELFRLTARAAMVIDAKTGEVHYARNPSLQLPPASTTKVLTALIALRETSPDELMRVSKFASSMPASKAYLRAGSILTSRDLLYALMLRSANDASVVIAEHIGGSVAGFARRMNETARAIGADESNFVTPNGLPASGHYATVRDLTTLMRAALATPGMRDLLSTPSIVIEPASGPGRRIALRSTNRMLWRDDLHIIGKTGWTRAAKRCFVGAASADGREVILAVLGSQDLWSDVELLAHYGLGQVVPGYREQRELQIATAPPKDPPAPKAVSNRAGRRAGGRAPTVAVAPNAQAERRQRVAAASARALRSRGSSSGTRAGNPGQQAAVRKKGALVYHVHLGTFPSRARAEQVQRAAAKRGYRPRVVRVGRTYRVTIADFRSRAEAARAVRSLSGRLPVAPAIIASR
ncbi:MAG: D-alanyl-D-alanine carboxypeptidase [Candidatus Binatia bacterium]